MKGADCSPKEYVANPFDELYILVCHQVVAGLKISDILADISVMFDTISAIDNRLREKSVISAIYRFWTDISWKYRVCGTRMC